MKLESEIAISKEKINMEKEFDYKKLAIVIICEFESDRMESGEKEVEKGMRYILKKYTKPHDREIIDDILMTFTGWRLESLVEKSKEISDSEVDEW